MRFTSEGADLVWWRAADVLAAVPWDGRRRIDPERLVRLEDALARFEFREVEEHLPREFRFRGIRFELGDVSLESGILVVRYDAMSGNTVRGKVEFRLERTTPTCYLTTVVASQSRTDRFLRPVDTRIFRMLTENFLEYVHVRF